MMFGHVGEVCESKWSFVLEVPDVDLPGTVELLFCSVLLPRRLLLW